MKRKIKLVSIDGDGCLFAYTNIGSQFHSSWDALGFAYGFKEVWDERGKTYYKDKDANKKWALEDSADMKGLHSHQAHKVLYPIPYSPGVVDFLTATKGKLVRGLLSGCIDMVGKKAAEDHSMDFCFCNTLHRENDIFLGTCDYAVPTWEKHTFIPQLCQKFGVTPEEICHVGDHENDISCFEQVGLAVAFNPKKEEVGRKAHHIIRDFAELNQILGI